MRSRDTFVTLGSLALLSCATKIASVGDRPTLPPGWVPPLEGAQDPTLSPLTWAGGVSILGGIILMTVTRFLTKVRRHCYITDCHHQRGGGIPGCDSQRTQTIQGTTMESIQDTFNAFFASTGAWFFFYVLGAITGSTVAGWLKAVVSKLKA